MRQKHYVDPGLDPAIPPAEAPCVPRSHFTVSKTGKRIYLDLKDRRGRTLMERQGNLNPDSLAIWEYLVGHDKWTSIIDIGANYGEMLLNVALPDSAAIVAVEPNANIHGYLSASLVDAGLTVTTLAKAVAAQSGQARMVIDDDWSGNSRLADPGIPGEAMRDGQLIHVETVTLADLIDTWDPSTDKRCLVKVDVEGWEIEVLSSLVNRLDGFAAFFAQVEILHLDDEGLSWSPARFDMYLLGLRSRQLHVVSQGDLHRLKTMLASGHYYGQDAVITFPMAPEKPKPPSPFSLPGSTPCGWWY
jgi:FkbM family methyltransferase